MSDRVVAALLMPPPAAEVPIRLEHETKPGMDRNASRLEVAVRVPLSALSFVPDGDSMKAQFTVHYALTGKSADFVSGVHGPQVVEVPAAEFESARRKTWTYVVPLHVQKAKYTVAIGVLDGVSHASGFARLDVDLK
jgi:hypothetical protein